MRATLSSVMVMSAIKSASMGKGPLPGTLKAGSAYGKAAGGVRSARGYNTYMVQFQYGWVSLWPHFSTREFAKNLTYCLCYGRKS